MNKGALVGLLGGLALGGVVGFWRGGVEEKVISAGIDENRERNGADRREVGASSERGIILGGVDLSETRAVPGEIKESFSGLLEIADPLERALKVRAMIAQMNEGNWEEFYEAVQEAAKHGFNLEGERLDFFAMMGRAGGVAAVERALADGVDNYGAVMHGWALVAPDAAMQFVEDEQERLEKTGRLREAAAATFGGLTRAYPEKGMAYMNALDDQQFSGLAWQFTRNLVRGGGLDGAEKWLENMMATDRPEQLKRVGVHHVAKHFGTALGAGKPMAEVMEFYTKFGAPNGVDDPEVSAKLIQGAIAGGERSDALVVLDQIEASGAQLNEQETARVLVLRAYREAMQLGRLLEENGARPELLNGLKKELGPNQAEMLERMNAISR